MNELHSVNVLVIFFTSLYKNVSPNQIALTRVNRFFSNGQNLSLSTVLDQLAGLVWA